MRVTSPSGTDFADPSEAASIATHGLLYPAAMVTLSGPLCRCDFCREIRTQLN